jgi:hypothetical protein
LLRLYHPGVFTTDTFFGSVFLLEGFSDTNCAGVTGDGVVANMVEDSDCEGENEDGEGEGVIMIEEHKVSKSHRRWMIIIRHFSMLSRKFKYVLEKGYLARRCYQIMN